MQGEFQQERRKQKALERLESDHPRCVHCGEDDWRCLEAHHIAGRAYDEACVVVCRNCHRKLSDAQKDHPPRVGSTEPVLFEQVGHFLLGLADLFEMLIAKMREYGKLLIEAAANHPPPHGWPPIGEGGAG